MMPPRLPFFGLLACLGWWSGAACLLMADDDLEFFEKKIRPVLVERCYGCHTAEAKQDNGGLFVDSRASMMRGGESGPAIVPHKADESLLLSALRYESLEMPPDGRLPEDVIANFTRWIERGALDPRVESDRPREALHSEIDYEAGRKFWAFQPPRPQSRPTVSRPEWSQRPIDVFVLAKLEEQGLTPNPPAGPRQLLRRLSYDLIGLPPSSAMLEEFVADPSPEAYARVVERLLESPQYGERWARLWLDLMRYGEDQAHIVGNNTSLCYPNAYLYRDWLVKAFNEDLPYDDFIRHQLAADRLPPEARAEVAALGFIGLGPKYYRRNSPEVMADEWEDRVDTLSRGILGLTVACARCHDHKFDPIGTEDYYALAGVFASTQMYNRPLDEQVKLDKNGEAVSEKEAMHIVREGEATDVSVMIRGDVNRLGPTVPRRFLRVLSSVEPSPFRDGSGRRELAEALVDRGNPLTARVMVNRLWGAFFGSHLVATPSNFGVKGQLPTHPELLDDLAVRWMEHGWSMKWLMREIVFSSTYQQSSEQRSEAMAVDPDNRWLGRMNRKHLPVEAWRDTVLAAAGRLEPSIGGKSFDPSDPAQTRRTLYSEVSRLSLNRMLATFDFPDPNAHSDRRAETVTPLQKLFVMNSPFMVQQAGNFASRLLEATQDPTHRIQLAYHWLFGREPTAMELQASLQFVGSSAERWRQWAQVMLATNELAFID
jgi:hypothetical protein